MEAQREAKVTQCSESDTKGLRAAASAFGPRHRATGVKRCGVGWALVQLCDHKQTPPQLQALVKWGQGSNPCPAPTCGSWGDLCVTARLPVHLKALVLMGNVRGRNETGLGGREGLR